MMDITVTLPSPELVWSVFGICVLIFGLFFLCMLAAISFDGHNYAMFTLCILLIIFILAFLFYAIFCTPKLGMQMFNLTILQANSSWGH